MKFIRVTQYGSEYTYLLNAERILSIARGKPAWKENEEEYCTHISFWDNNNTHQVQETVEQLMTQIQGVY